MTSPTIEQIYRHSSVRRYKPDPVPRAMIETIIAAGQRSSTSSNLQTYSVVAVTDPKQRDRLATLCGEQDFIRQAPVFLAWCADLSRMDRICQRRGYKQVTRYVENFLVAVVDAAIAMQTAALAAESLDLGICYVGAIRNQPRQIIALLGLPRLVFPISGMAVGWPKGESLKRPRLPLEAVLHWESYDHTAEQAALRAYDQAMIATGIYRGRKVPSPRTESKDEEYGWQEHSARRVSNPTRVDLSQVLAEQKFSLE